MKGTAKLGRVGAFGALVLAWGIGEAGTLAAVQEEDSRRARRGVALDRPGFDGARPVLGVLLSMQLERELDSVGVRVNSVSSGSPAAEAGVEGGDVIVSFDGHDLGLPLDDAIEREFEDERSFPAQRLIALLKDAEAGEAVELIVRRDGEELPLDVTPEAWRKWAGDRVWFDRMRFDFGPDYQARLRGLGDRLRDSDNWPVRAPRVRVPEMSEFGTVFRFGRGRVRGLDLVEVNPGLGAYFGTETGVLVAEVDEDSALGLRPGDVVVGIDGREVEDEEEFRRIFRSYEEGDEIRFRIWRDGGETTVSGTVE